MMQKANIKQVLFLICAAWLSIAGAVAQTLTADRPAATRWAGGIQQVFAGAPVGQNPAYRVPFKASQSGVTINGTMIGADNWTEEDEGNGMYSFKAKAPITLNTLRQYYELAATGGGVKVGGTYYVLWSVMDWGMRFTTYATFDTDTWELTGERLNNALCIARDLTHDATTGTVYGCFVRKDDSGQFLGTMALADGAQTEIAPLAHDLCALAADGDGHLYGIGTDGNLYSISKTDGEETLIGQTGLEPDGQQSATFDTETGILYWAAALTGGQTALYTVRTDTGEAELIGTFPNNERLTGIYVAEALAKDGAPAQVDNLALDFPEGTLTGNVCFTMPTTTYAGETLSGEGLAYNIFLDDEKVGEGEAQPGQQVSHEITLERGRRTVTVAALNAEGRSPLAKAAQWFGLDAPVAPTNVKLTTDESNRLYVEWEAPTEGQNGGYIDPAQLNYTIIRYPEGVTVAEHYTDTSIMELMVMPEGMTNIWYDVTAYCGDIQGLSAESNKIVVGEAFTVPYSQDFAQYQDFSFFTVIDANEDQATWYWDWDGTVKIRTIYSDSMDDWLITPPIRFSTGNRYKLAFDAKTLMFGETIEVCIGHKPTVEQMQTVIVPDTVLDIWSGYETIEKEFQVSEPGDYYVGLHLKTPTNTSGMFIRSIEITGETLGSVPAAVTDFTATAADKGELKATVSFTAPTICEDGTELTAITDIKLYRNENLLQTFTGIEPGDQLEYIDNEAVQGENTYSAIVTGENGAGQEAKQTVWVGVDVPSVPANVHVEMVDGRPHITWLAPTEGANGRYIDTEKMIFFVVRDNDATVIANGIRELEVTDEEWTEPEHQEFLRYVVYACTDAGLGVGGVTNSVLVGKPYELPFEESFAEGKLQSWPWTSLANYGTYAYWKIAKTGENPSAEAQDGDGGLCTFYPGNPGESSLLHSSRISLQGEAWPVLSFYYYFAEGTDHELMVQVSADDEPFQTVSTIDMANAEANAWNRVELPLASFATAKYIQVGIRANSGQSQMSLHVDNIRIEGGTPTGIAQPQALATIATGKGSIIVNGAADGVKVYATDGRQVAATQGAGNAVLRVPAGVYIVKQGRTSQKITVR